MSLNLKIKKSETLEMILLNNKFLHQSKKTYTNQSVDFSFES